MRILVLSQYFYPDVTAAAFRVTETCDLLSQRGHDVQVITAYPHKSGVSPGSDAEKRAWVRKLHIREYKGRGIVDYLLHYWSFAAKTLLLGTVLGIRIRPDVIWATSPPLTCGSVGAIISSILRIPLVLDIRDIWPDSAAAAGVISDDSRWFRLAQSLERFTYRKARALTCVSNTMKQHLCGKVDENRVNVVFNGVSESRLSESSAVSKIEKRIVYAGNLGRAQDVEIFVDSFVRANVNAIDAGWKLMLIGDGVLKEAIKKKIAEFGVGDQIRILPPMGKTELFEYMRASNTLLMGLRSHPALALTIPSKVFDYLAVNRPIIAMVTGEAARLVRDNSYNRVIEPGNGEALAKEFRRLTSREYPSKYPISNHSLLRTSFTREENTMRLEDVLRRASTKVET